MRQTTFIASYSGEIVAYTPPPPGIRPNRLERQRAYCQGVQRTADYLKTLGFNVVSEAEYSVSLACQEVLIDFRVQIPDNVAHVTSARSSRLGDLHSQIYRLRDEIKSDYCLQIVAGRNDSLPPVYVALEESLERPAEYIFKNVVGYLALLTQRGHAVGDALKKLAHCPPADWLAV